MSTRFANTELRAHKRKISRFEKSALPTTTGRALLLPGDVNGEVEELVAAGYDPTRIFGVERESDTYARLFDFYRDSVHIVQTDIFSWMRDSKAKGTYTYLHLDLCGHLARSDFHYYQHWSELFAPQARVRVSLFRGRRSAAQFDWESQLYDELLLHWCRLGYELDAVDPQRWQTHYDVFAANMDDTTRLVVGLLVMNLFFGIKDYRSYIDTCVEEEDYLPHVMGSHTLTNIMRLTYNEPGINNHMFTVWMDLAPLENPLRTSQQWTLDELDRIFSQVSFHIPHYNPSNF